MMRGYKIWKNVVGTEIYFPRKDFSFKIISQVDFA